MTGSGVTRLFINGHQRITLRYRPTGYGLDSPAGGRFMECRCGDRSWTSEKA